MVMSTPYDHYYIQGMPAISLLGGIFVEKLIGIHEKLAKGNPQSKAFTNSIKINEHGGIRTHGLCLRRAAKLVYRRVSMCIIIYHESN